MNNKGKRSSIGMFVHSISPGLYRNIINFWNAVKYFFINRRPFITDNLGGSFKTYIQEHHLDELKRNLFQGLDGHSIHEMEVIINRLIHLPDKSEFDRQYAYYSLFRYRYKGERLDTEQYGVKSKIEKELEILNSKFINLKFESSVGYFHHGLTLLPEAVLQKITGTVFIDIGAYVGDSALAFCKYGYSKIYSFDISSKSIYEYKMNMKLNSIQEHLYEVNQAVVGGESGKLFTFTDSGSPGLSVIRKNSGQDNIQVKSITIDDFCMEKSVSPKLIKADMEGHAMEFILGALKTIKQSRPVLLIAVYHNPVEFFAIKPMLQSHLENYTYLMRKIDPGLERNACHSEVFLIAYPNEIAGVN